MMYWAGEWGTGLGGLFLVLMETVLVFGIVLIIRSIVRITGRGGENDRILEILKRYAQGEITKEEYERRKDDLVKRSR